MGHAPLTFLKDRRVLYVPSEVEVRHQCIMSVLEIRRYLTEVLAAGGTVDELSDHLRAMRSACRKFLTAVGHNDPMDQLWFPEPRDSAPGLQNWSLNQALGELRGVFGVHVAQITAKYGVDVEDGLASILPLSGKDEQSSQLMAVPSTSKVPCRTGIGLVRRRCGSANWRQPRTPNLPTGRLGGTIPVSFG